MLLLSLALLLLNLPLLLLSTPLFMLSSPLLLLPRVCRSFLFLTLCFLTSSLHVILIRPSSVPLLLSSVVLLSVLDSPAITLPLLSRRWSLPPCSLDLSRTGCCRWRPTFRSASWTGRTGKDDTPVATARRLPGESEEERDTSGKLWRTVLIGDQEQRIDMQVIRPYLRVVTHGGYYGEGLNAIIVFSACYLPDNNCEDYTYIMENLFLYVVSSLELLVAEDYMIIYLNGATPRRRMPGISWLKRCYQMIDRKLRKNLKCLVIVHPTWFIRTVIAISRPFISVKFLDKIRYVQTLEELSQIIPMEHVQIPDCVLQYDDDKIRTQKERLDQDKQANPIPAKERPKSMIADVSRDI